MRTLLNTSVAGWHYLGVPLLISFEIAHFLEVFIAPIYSLVTMPDKKTTPILERYFYELQTQYIDNLIRIP